MSQCSALACFKDDFGCGTRFWAERSVSGTVQDPLVPRFDDFNVGMWQEATRPPVRATLTGSRASSATRENVMVHPSDYRILECPNIPTIQFQRMYRNT